MYLDSAMTTTSFSIHFLEESLLGMPCQRFQFLVTADNDAGVGSPAIYNETDDDWDIPCWTTSSSRFSRSSLTEHTLFLLLQGTLNGIVGLSLQKMIDGSLQFYSKSRGQHTNYICCCRGRNILERKCHEKMLDGSTPLQGSSKSRGQHTNYICCCRGRNILERKCHEKMIDGSLLLGSDCWCYFSLTNPFRCYRTR